ncbi:hypothetical protein GIB67_023563 [Kingdonia uniflora]|uniref:Thioredoxin domain-containing protein n=1 Tax=Kingdonia uniflora TaxID=39325 RepID=A0A7J7PAH2_9MAGN|nr:hypothetical protein GIB67_023563 [Kingdonia uniflora]
MATIRNFLSKPPSSLQTLTKLDPLISPCSTSISLFSRPKPIIRLKTRREGFVARATTARVTRKVESDERVQQVHNTEEFDEALRTAKNKLVVVEYAASHSYHSRKIYPFMVDLSKTCNDVEFLLVMGDESNDTKALCEREKIDKVPHFSFYKSMEKIHEEEGIGPDMLMGDVLYYGDNHSAVVQLHSRDDVEKLIGEHKIDHKLIVLDVGLKHCGPCVKVYPTVLKLSKQMVDTVVFARMNGDENESCMKFLKDMEVVEVPTFLFIRDSEICGSSIDGEANILCATSERQALLTFKKSLTDHSQRLSSWVGDNCCSWKGIGCDNKTGSVVRLALGLSFGDILNLEYNDLGGLSFLDENLQWLSQLSNLEHLDMSGVNFSKASNWLQVVNTIPSLLELRLSSCNLKCFPSLPYANFTSLEIFDISRNKINSSLPDWLYTLNNLTHLDLGGNYFHGAISPSIGNLTSLTDLQLAYNQLSGPLP